MTLTNFWIVAGASLVIIVACMVINNAQYQLLKRLTNFLQLTVKPSLIRNGEPNKARKISLDELPKIQEWFGECQNYGWINLLGLGSSLGLLVSGGVYHSLSYIIVMLSGLFVASNIFFLPRAFIRLNKAIEINNSYVLLLSVFDKAQEIKTNDTGSASSS